MKRFILLALLVGCNGKPKPLCTDADGDGVTAGASKTCGGDCNDNDRTVFRTVTLFTDADGDGYGVGTGTATCIGLLIPKGFADKAGDCDDTHAACTVDCTDADHDGTPACAGDCDDSKPHCIADCTDHDGDGYCVDHDCNDNSALHWDDCTTCVDNDNDGYGLGCDIGTVDCNDNDTDNWDACSTCVDNDHDLFFTGCDRYVTRQGEDCDDTSPACTLDCQDDDGDKVSACHGDCNDSRGTSTPCDVFAQGAPAEIATVSGGNGGTITFAALQTLTLLASEDPLPAGLETSGAVPALATADIVCAAASSLNLNCFSRTLFTFPVGDVPGLFVPEGVTLTLSGPGPFTFTSTDDVFIGGTIVTDTPGVAISFNGDAAHDFTLSGSIDTHASKCTSLCDGGNVSINGFANVAIVGSINASGAAAPSSGIGGVGGTVTIHDLSIYLAAPIDLHDGETQNGSTQPLGGVLDVKGTNIVARVNMTAVGGAALGGTNQVPGSGGKVTLSAANQLASSPNVLLTLSGGTATGNAGNGGQGGTCLVTGQNGSSSEIVSSPSIVAVGGASANAEGGPGGSVTISAGDDSGSVSRQITVAGFVDVSGGTIGAGTLGPAGTILVANDDSLGVAAASISVSGALTAKGTSGGRIDVGAFSLPLATGGSTGYGYSGTGTDITLAANLTSNGIVDFNGDTLTGVSTVDVNAGATCHYDNTATTTNFSVGITGVTCTAASDIP